jgi:hypothetical protein
MGAPPLPVLDEHAPVRSGARYRIWRTPRALAIQLFDVIDDAASEEWRAACLAELAQGRPTFAVFDATGAVPENSLASRMRTAMFAREQAAQFQRVLVRGDAGNRFAVVGRVLLRPLIAAGLGRVVDHEEDAARFEAKLRALV